MTVGMMTKGMIPTSIAADIVYIQEPEATVTFENELNISVTIEADVVV